jgi:hypothetical protein
MMAEYMDGSWPEMLISAMTSLKNSLSKLLVIESGDFLLKSGDDVGV